MLARKIFFILLITTLSTSFPLIVQAGHWAIAADQVAKSARVIKAPLGLPPVPVPADNPLTPEKIARGRRLYYDPILLVDKTVACATCHHPG